jgi:hypothetical protein
LHLSGAIAIHRITTMKLLREIPKAIREMRERLYAMWRLAKTPAERDALIPRAPRVSARASFWPYNSNVRSLTAANVAQLAEKDLEIEWQRRQLADRSSILAALRAELEAAKSRIVSLQNRRDQILRENIEAPQRAIQIAASLGFDLTTKSEKPKPE